MTLIMLSFFVQSDINVFRHMHKNLQKEIKFFRSLKCFFGFELNKGKVCFKFDVKTVYFILMGYMYLRRGLLKIICYDVSWNVINVQDPRKMLSGSVISVLEY